MEGLLATAKRVLCVAGLAVLVLCLVGCGKADEVEGPSLVESAKSLRVGMNVDEVVKKLGAPAPRDIQWQTKNDALGTGNMVYQYRSDHPAGTWLILQFDGSTLIRMNLTRMGDSGQKGGYMQMLDRPTKSVVTTFEDDRKTTEPL